MSNVTYNGSNLDPIQGPVLVGNSTTNSIPPETIAIDFSSGGFLQESLNAGTLSITQTWHSYSGLTTAANGTITDQFQSFNEYLTVGLNGIIVLPNGTTFGTGYNPVVTIVNADGSAGAAAGTVSGSIFGGSNGYALPPLSAATFFSVGSGTNANWYPNNTLVGDVVNQGYVPPTGSTAGSPGTSLFNTIVPNAVTTTKIANTAVTYPKMQVASGNVLLGNPLNIPGIIQEITIGSNLSVSNGTLSASIGGGGGTGVSLINTGTGLTGGPINSTGTISMAASGVVPGTYNQIVVDALGRVTLGALLNTLFSSGPSTASAIPVFSNSAGTSFTSTQITIDGSNNVGNINSLSIGTTNLGQLATSNSILIAGGAAAPIGIALQSASPDVVGGTISFYKARGALTAPVAVQNGDTLGGIAGYAYNGSYYVGVGGITLAVDTSGVVSGSGMPTKLIFSTGSDGTNGGIARMSISENGGVVVGSPTGSSFGTGSINAQGLYVNGTAVSVGGGVQLDNGNGNPNTHSASGLKQTSNGISTQFVASYQDVYTTDTFTYGTANGSVLLQTGTMFLFHENGTSTVNLTNNANIGDVIGIYAEGTHDYNTTVVVNATQFIYGPGLSPAGTAQITLLPSQEAFFQFDSYAWNMIIPPVQTQYINRVTNWSGGTLTIGTGGDSGNMYLSRNVSTFNISTNLNTYDVIGVTTMNDYGGSSVATINAPLVGTNQHIFYGQGLTGPTYGSSVTIQNGQVFIAMKDNGGNFLVLANSPASAAGTVSFVQGAGTAVNTGGTTGLAIGNGGTNTAIGGIAIGYSSQPSGYGGNSGIGGIQIGYVGTNTGSQGIQIGWNGSTTGNYGIALGHIANSQGQSSIAIGNSAETNFSDSIAIGPSAQAGGANSVSMGGGAEAGSASIAIGPGAQALANNAIAIGGGTAGFGAQANYDNSIVIGYGQATGTGQVIINGTELSTGGVTLASNSGLSIYGTNDPFGRVGLALNFYQNLPNYSPQGPNTQLYDGIAVASDAGTVGYWTLYEAANYFGSFGAIQSTTLHVDALDSPSYNTLNVITRTNSGLAGGIDAPGGGGGAGVILSLENLAVGSGDLGTNSIIAYQNVGSSVEQTTIGSLATLLGIPVGTVTPGTYNNVTVGSNGLVTAGTNVRYIIGAPNGDQTDQAIAVFAGTDGTDGFYSGGGYSTIRADSSGNINLLQGGLNASQGTVNAAAFTINGTPIGTGGSPAYIAATGNATITSGDLAASAFGNNANATGSSATALGAGANALGQNSVAIGIDARAVGLESIAFVDGTATGIHSIAMGFQSIAQGTNALVFGAEAGTSNSGNNSVIMGTNAQAGQDSYAIGQNASATGSNSIAIGANALATGDNAIVIGGGTATAGQVVINGTLLNTGTSYTAGTGLGISSGTIALNYNNLGSYVPSQLEYESIAVQNPGNGSAGAYNMAALYSFIAQRIADGVTTEAVQSGSIGFQQTYQLRTNLATNGGLNSYSNSTYGTGLGLYLTTLPGTVQPVSGTDVVAISQFNGTTYSTVQTPISSLSISNGFNGDLLGSTLTSSTNGTVNVGKPINMGTSDIGLSANNAIYFNGLGGTDWRMGRNLPINTDSGLSDFLAIQFSGTNTGQGFVIGNENHAYFEITNDGTVVLSGPAVTTAGEFSTSNNILDDGSTGAATFAGVVTAGTLQASNFSGTSSGTNTGDVTIGGTTVTALTLGSNLTFVNGTLSATGGSSASYVGGAGITVSGTTISSNISTLPTISGAHWGNNNYNLFSMYDAANGTTGQVDFQTTLMPQIAGVLTGQGTNSPITTTGGNGDQLTFRSGSGFTMSAGTLNLVSGNGIVIGNDASGNPNNAINVNIGNGLAYGGGGAPYGNGTTIQVRSADNSIGVTTTGIFLHLNGQNNSSALLNNTGSGLFVGLINNGGLAGVLGTTSIGGPNTQGIQLDYLNLPTGSAVTSTDILTVAQSGNPYQVVQTTIGSLFAMDLGTINVDAINFSGTTTPPANTTTPVAWGSVMVNGTAYKTPFYQ